MPHWSNEYPQPPWPKSHDAQLEVPEVYKAAAEAGGSDAIDRHRPLAQVDADGERRKAGTIGVQDCEELMDESEDEGFAEAESGQEEIKEAEPAEEARGGVAETTSGTSEPILRGTGDTWEEALKNGSRVVSIRDVKQSTIDYKLENPKNHAFARFVLPVTEDVIKGQQWLGRKPSEKPLPSQDQTKKDQPPLPVPTAEELEFRAALKEEANTIARFRNNDGRPDGHLKLLDGDALHQLESHLSVEDQSTPDSWIPRSAHLRRLTGKHPLNAEPDLKALFDAELITPTKLHYVRNHGAVPQLSWETHRLLVTSEPAGLVTTRSWTMDELSDGRFRVIEIPVTVACDGNRRKEVNMVKRTAGFNWAASGISTCLWRGVLVRDVLLASGLADQPDTERWYLNYEGADKPSEGSYATSIPLMHAMDPTNDVMLAFGMNRRVLHPDHGYPLRSIIPGYVGGRQVKWLSKIWISKEPNTSHYHIWDNRVVPSIVDFKTHPLADAFFHHTDTACNEQALQSVICRPAHGERVITLPAHGGEAEFYTIEGFAHCGGGANVDRVEVSLNEGKTWRYAIRRFVEKPLRHGNKHWAWVFWKCKVPLRDLVTAGEIAVRAFDSRKNVQPKEITWNVLGMMNNAWYRVKRTVDPPNDTEVEFRHPVAPGIDEGGWMPPNPDDKEIVDDSNPKLANILSLQEIEKHNMKASAWIILDNKVYDVTNFLGQHPGGEQSLLVYAGKATVNAWNEYQGIHDNYADGLREECLVGVLSEEGIEAMKKDAERAAQALAKLKEERKGFALQPDEYTRAKLSTKKSISHDTRVYTFTLPPQPDGERAGKMGLPVGRHIQLAVHFQNQAVLRSYTPIRPVLESEEDGTFDLLVKTYFPIKMEPDKPEPGFAPGGTVSNYLDCMKEGEEIDIRGPTGEITYLGRGKFDIEGTEYTFDKINLVAGGSGITPHWQLIHAILSDPNDKTLISLINSNTTIEDIVLFDGLNKYATDRPQQFRLWHALSKAPNVKNWPYAVGRLDKALIEKQFFPNGPRVGVFLCGPTTLIEKGALPALEALKYRAKGEGRNIFGF